MMTECCGSDYPLYQPEDVVQHGAKIFRDDLNMARQLIEDSAVHIALGSLVKCLRANGQMPKDASIWYGGDPLAAGIQLEAFVALEGKAYGKAGYGQRAEKEGLIADAYRGYTEDEHGPLRFGLTIEEGEPAEGRRVPRLLAFFDLFHASRHFADAEDDYAKAAARWERVRHPSVRPEIYIVSKLVADPRIPRSAAALPGLSIATVLQAIANVYPSGIYVAAQAQPATQRFVAGHLQRRYISNLEVLLNKQIVKPAGHNRNTDGKAEKAEDAKAPTKMLIYIPVTSENEG